MNSSVFGHLEASLNDYFNEVVRKSADADESTAMHIARVELPRIVSARQAALENHRPDEYGRCATCRTRRFGRASVPCRSYLTAHLVLLADASNAESSHAHTTARKSEDYSNSAHSDIGQVSG
jgi:hypothetical protein